LGEGLDMNRIRGNPKRLAENVTIELEKDLRKLLEESLTTSLKLLEDKERRLINDLLDTLRDEYMRMEESFRSLKARLDLNLKTAVTREKSKFIDEVISTVIKRLKERKAEDWYIEFMKKILERLAKESEEAGELIVEVAEEDKNLVKNMIEELNKQGAKLKLSERPANIIGGAIARSENSGLTIDYSLDLFIKENETLLRSVAARALFGTS
jgi:vacuolar-type H+-ATPase subunit E/Vma4